MEQTIYKKASFEDRFFAFLVDQVILLIVNALVAIFLYAYVKDSINIATWGIGVLYGTCFLWLSGSTPGKRLLHIKVVGKTYSSIGPGKAFIRESIGKLVSGIFFNLGYLWMIIDKENRTWHDMIANTYAVKTDAAGVLIPIEKEEPVTDTRKLIFAGLFLFFGLPLPLLFGLMFIYLFVAAPFQVSGDAMAPNYTNGQYYLASKFIYRSGEPQRGDVIVFHAPIDPSKDFIKRVIGLPGETVSLHGGDVYVNNQLLDESAYHIQHGQTFSGVFLREDFPINVPQGQYFVLGDNRQNSSDSRMWGFVKKNAIVGKMLFCYYRCKSDD